MGDFLSLCSVYERWGYLFIVSAKLDGVGDEPSRLLLRHRADVLQSDHQLESKEQN